MNIRMIRIILNIIRIILIRGIRIKFADSHCHVWLTKINNKANKAKNKFNSK